MPESQLKIWYLAARPKTLPAAAAPVIIGCAMAYADQGFHLLSALAALFGALFIQIGTNLANDYFDFKKGIDRDDRLGPERVTQTGMVTAKQIKIATFIAFLLAFLLGIYLVYRGGIPIVIIGLLSILFGVLYTGGPAPIGYIGLADIFVLIFFGPIAVGGTYFVQTGYIENYVLIAGLAPGLFSTAILTVNNYRDIESDRKSGKKTLAIRFGKTFSKMEYLFSIIIPLLIPLILYIIYDRGIYAIASSLVIIPAIPVIKTFFTREGKILNDTLASTGKLLFLFSIIFSIGWLL